MLKFYNRVWGTTSKALEKSVMMNDVRLFMVVKWLGKIMDGLNKLGITWMLGLKTTAGQ